MFLIWINKFYHSGEACMKVPFNKVYLTNNELTYIKTVLENGHIWGDGFYTKLVESLIKEKVQTEKVFMTTSGTHALEMAAMMIGLNPGDEVIMPSFTFPSTANAVMLRGAIPVFCEVEETHLSIDPSDVKRKITRKTKAIIAVHYGGISCNMERIMEIAEAHDLYLIEDAAQGFNSQYRNRYLGTIGHLGCFSFHATKNYTGGEGGALLVNDVRLLKSAETIRNMGTNRSEFLRKEIDKYSWVGVGSKYIPSDILMAFLYAQMQEIDKITEKRRYIFDYYADHLKKYVEQGVFQIPSIPKNCRSNYHLFYLLFSRPQMRNLVIEELNMKGVEGVIHFVPLHSSPMGQKLGYRRGDLPLTERVGNSLLRLPVYNSITEQELEYVVKSLEDIMERKSNAGKLIGCYSRL